MHFKKIKPEKIIGLAFYFKKLSVKNTSILNEYINMLKEITILLYEINKDIPIYDFSKNKEINKEKLLKLNI